MGCDYYVESSLIIDYISDKGNSCRIITNTTRKRGYVTEKEETSFLKSLKRMLKKNTGIKMLYDNKEWLKEKYQKRYEKKLKKRFPEILEYKQIFKDYVAWPT
jgi:hypothetical protein